MRTFGIASSIVPTSYDGLRVGDGLQVGIGIGPAQRGGAGVRVALSF